MSEVSLADLGVHPCKLGPEDANPYIARSVDEELLAALRDPGHKVVEVVAHRLAGATRTLAHNARGPLGDHTVVAFVDDPRVPLEAMVAAAGRYAPGSPGTVLWLERLDTGRLIELAALDLNSLPDGLRILATSDLDAYGPLKQPERDRLIQRNTQVFLAGLGRDESPERPSYSAVRKRMVISVVEVYAGRELVDWDGIRTALDPHDADPDLLAVVRAVTDWQRIGRPGPLTRDRLFELYRRYRETLRRKKSDTEEGTPGEEDFQRALDHARAPAQDHPALVTTEGAASDEHFVPHPLLTAIADETQWHLSFVDPSVASRIGVLTGKPLSEGASIQDIVDPDIRGWPIPAPMWEYVDEAFTGPLRYEIANRAMNALEAPAAHRLITGSGVEPDSEDRLSLGMGLMLTKDFDTARTHLTRAMEADDPETAAEARLQLDNLERLEGDAVPFSARPATGKKDPLSSGRDAARRIGGLDHIVAEARGVENALTALADIARNGERHAAANAMIRAGELEYARGKVDAARERYLSAVRTRIDVLAPTAALKLGDLERRHGEARDAEIWFYRAMDCGHPAVVPLARLGIGRVQLAAAKHEHAFRELLLATASRHPVAMPWALVESADAAYELGEHGTARTCYQMAADTGHTECAARGLYGLGVMAMDERDVAVARDWLIRCVEAGHRATMARALVRLGRLERTRGDVEAARKWLTQAAGTGIAEAAAEAMFLLGSLEHGEGRLDEALQWSERAAESGVEPFSSKAVPLVAQGLKQRGDIERALPWYERVIKVGNAGQQAVARHFLALIAREKGDHEKARDGWTHLVEEGPESHRGKAMLHLGQLAEDSDDLQGAHEWYSRAVEEGDSGSRGFGLLNLGFLAQKRGDFEQALEHYERAARIGHSAVSPEAMYRSACAYRDWKGDRASAESWFKLCLRAKGSEWAAWSMGQLGLSAEEDGDTERARQWYELILESGHDSVVVAALLHLAILDQEDGDLDRARERFLLTLEHDDPHRSPLALYRLGELEEEQEDTAKARDWYSRAGESGHKEAAPAAMYRLGLLEKSEGDTDAARTWWRRLLEFEGAEDTELYTKARAELADMDPDS
ncbi:tetratricopeptide repeat protein [Nocardiopsis sp. RSe5-2]|uniref:Tetratricopeptide repeat protein n=1 Tax=Nocardiopsis endophytica TaxID=3018445 RepID=A0ABT4UDI3_9ACTN|nr:tetratricopeptide repeat protein [Nocardiopsis endophytica]MDA2815043.1 tetratricopeptide repeat protein [Nocardiopsis endophytica]